LCRPIREVVRQVAQLGVSDRQLQRYLDACMSLNEGPGGRIGIVVNAVDMPFWVNVALDPALKAKVDTPGLIGGGVAPKGIADASLYRRLSALGLTGLKCFPQLVSVVPGSERIERYQQQILAALTPPETTAWQRAVAAAEREGTFFIAQPYHCAVATKPD
jgi:hypothetical protein